MRALWFLFVSALRGRLARGVWQLAELAERRALAAGDVSKAARIRCSTTARWARARLEAQGLDVPAMGRRLRVMADAIQRHGPRGGPSSL